MRAGLISFFESIPQEMHATAVITIPHAKKAIATAILWSRRRNRWNKGLKIISCPELVKFLRILQGVR